MELQSMIILIALGVVGIFILTLISKCVYLVQQAQVVIIERLGKFNRILGPGLHFVTPLVEAPRFVRWVFIRVADNGKYYRQLIDVSYIDLRESVYDFPKQNVITRDNVTMEINALLYYQITDPRAAVYEVSNLPEAIEKLTQTTLRNVIGSMDLDQSLTSRDEINEKLRIILDEATDKWGVKVNRVELQEVNPPADIRHAMEKQMRAERDRRASILEAEGFKRSQILRAEAVQESQVLEAQGRAQATILSAQAESEARLKIADAEAKAIEMVQKAVPGADPLPYLTALKYMNTLPEMFKGKDDKLIVVPYEASGLTGSVAAIKQIFEQAK